MPRHLRVLLPLLLLGQSSCVALLYDDRCGPEHRQALVRGSVRDDAGVALAIADVRVSEQKGDSVPGHFHLYLNEPVGVSGSPIRGHVKHAIVLDRDGVIVREYAMSEGHGQDITVGIYDPIRDAGVAESLRDRLLRAPVTLVLQTDLPSMAELRGVLSYVEATDFQRAHCS